MRWLGRVLATVVVLVTAAIVAYLTVPPVRSAARTVGLIADLLELPLRPLSALTTAPRRLSTTYADPADRMDVYLPSDAPPDRRLAAVVLSLGIHPLPLDHPDVMRIAGAMARLGVVVGVPDSAALRESRVTVDEPARLADAVLVIGRLPEVDPARVGLAGFSAGASVALVASADPRISSKLTFVSAFGAYADAETLLVDMATRTMELGAEVRAWAPEPRIRRDIAALLVAAIAPSAERDRLTEVLRPLIGAGSPPDGPDPEILASFSEGDVRAAYMLFSAPDRTTARAAIAGASDRVRMPLAAISPVATAAAIRAPVYLLHGQTDRSIPVSHARMIAGALPPERVARLTIFSLFEHGQPGKAGIGLADLPDLWQLYLYLQDLVAIATE